eukprot:256087_1
MSTPEIKPNTEKQFEQLQRSCESIVTDFKDEQHDINRPLANYKFILTHYKNKSMYDDKSREYIFNFLVSSCQALMQRKYIHFKNDYNMADATIECCKLLIEIAIPFITNNVKWAAEIIYECLNGERIKMKLTKSLQYLPHMSEWRKSLNETKNNRCDFYEPDGTDDVCHVTIVETDAAANRIRIKFDDENPAFRLLWIGRDSNCLQPFGTNGEVKIVEDDNDPQDENIFAVYRGKLINESFHMIEILNSFGKYGGFDAVLKFLSNATCLDVSLLSLYLHVLSMCYKSYTKSFGKKFMPAMYKSVVQILESLHVNQLSKLDTSIAISLRNLMRRYYTTETIQETQAKWQSEITLSVLHCASERINGEMDNLLAFIGSKSMLNWVRNNNIWRCLLGLTNVILCKSDVLITGYTRQYFSKEMSTDLLNLMQMWFEDYSNSDNMIYFSKFLRFMDNENQITDMDMDMFFNAMISTVNKEGIKVLSAVVISRWDIIGPMIMKRCVHNLMQHIYIIETFTILMTLWELSRTTGNANEYIMIGHMIDNENLLQHYFNDIKYFKCYVRMSITDDMDASEINDMKLFIDQNSYLEHVEGRINFLNYISVHYNALKLTNIEKNMLYQEFVENALTKEEKEMAITRLKSIAELKLHEKFFWEFLHLQK